MQNYLFWRKKFPLHIGNAYIFFKNIVSLLSIMKIGLLTGGGDCPGLNAVIRAIGKKGIIHYNDEFIGLKNGWAGLLSLDYIELERRDFSGILHLGGTILGSSRTNPEKEEGGFDAMFIAGDENEEEHNLSKARRLLGWQPETHLKLQV